MVKAGIVGVKLLQLVDRILRRLRSQVNVIGRLLSPVPGPLRKVSFRQSLGTSGDSLAKKFLVKGAGLFSEDLEVPVPEFSDGHP